MATSSHCGLARNRCSHCPASLSRSVAIELRSQEPEQTNGGAPRTARDRRRVGPVESGGTRRRAPHRAGRVRVESGAISPVRVPCGRSRRTDGVGAYARTGVERRPGVAERVQLHRTSGCNQRPCSGRQWHVQLCGDIGGRRVRRAPSTGRPLPVFRCGADEGSRRSREPTSDCSSLAPRPPPERLLRGRDESFEHHRPAVSSAARVRRSLVARTDAHDRSPKGGADGEGAGRHTDKSAASHPFNPSYCASRVAHLGAVSPSGQD